MARLAVISDVHSNIEALDAVLYDISSQEADRIVCLGDNIGYGPDPEKVIKKLQEFRITAVQGNHEYALLNSSYKSRFNPESAKALDINKKMLSIDALEYISSLNTNAVCHDALFIHGISLILIDGYLFNLPDDELISRTKALQKTVIFVGHTHQLGIYEIKGNCVNKKKLKEKHVLSKNSCTIVNAGSVGQPRSMDHEAAYVIWDTENNEVEPKLVEYDYQFTAFKIRRAGIPERFADVL